MDFCDTEAYRCTMESDDFFKPELDPESKYGLIGKSNGKTCAAVGCNKKKHPNSKYCPYHKLHRPRSVEAYERMVDRY